MLLPSLPEPRPGDVSPCLLVKGMPVFARDQPVSQCLTTRQVMVAELRRVHRLMDYHPAARQRWLAAHALGN